LEENQSGERECSKADGGRGISGNLKDIQREVSYRKPEQVGETQLLEKEEVRSRKNRGVAVGTRQVGWEGVNGPEGPGGGKQKSC